MFTVARWGGKYVSRIFRTKDDELFTILFFGLAVAFGGIGELLGVTDAIGAFLIGLVLGATKYRDKIEQLSLPMRDVFGAFFFLNFGLGLNPSLFGQVLLPVAGAVLMTLVLNILAGQFVAWLNKLGPQAGINTTVILQNRGEFALILATLAMAAGLDDRIVPFAGLYVLVMSIFGPILASNSERIGGVILGTNRKKAQALATRERTERDRMNQEAIALVAAASSDSSSDDNDGDDDLSDSSTAGMEAFVRTHTGARSSDDGEAADGYVDDGDSADPQVVDRLIQQAMQQSDQQEERKRDPEY
jgi:CPA2 family monovalent cation:H+ antiporter-2